MQIATSTTTGDSSGVSLRRLLANHVPEIPNKNVYVVLGA